MTDKLRDLLKDVQTVYEGKGMVVHPNSFDKLIMEVIKLVNINKQQDEQIRKMRNFQNCDYQLHFTDCPVFKSGGHMSCKKCPFWILQEISE